jgi:hypothetical protein
MNWGGLPEFLKLEEVAVLIRRARQDVFERAL